MKLITVDANCAHHCKASCPNGRRVLELLLKKKLKLVVNKELLNEIARTCLGDVYRDLVLAGQVLHANDADCARDKKKILHNCKSNDAR